MRHRAAVIAIGQREAGDDGVALAVIDHMAAAGKACVALHAIDDAADLIPLLELHRGGPVVVLDAVLDDGEVGSLVRIPVDGLLDRGDRPLSSHGLGVGQAIALAGVLDPAVRNLDVRVVGIRVHAPLRRGRTLSPEAARAVPRVAAAVLAMLEE